jgi:hypothetical protein
MLNISVILTGKQVILWNKKFKEYSNINDDDTLKINYKYEFMMSCDVLKWINNHKCQLEGDPKQIDNCIKKVEKQSSELIKQLKRIREKVAESS